VVFPIPRQNETGPTPYFHSSLRISPIHDHAGKLVGAVAIARDIGERKRLEAQLRNSHAWVEQLVTSMAVGVYATDADGRIIRYNDEMVRVWGAGPR